MKGIVIRKQTIKATFPHIIIPKDTEVEITRKYELFGMEKVNIRIENENREYSIPAKYVKEI
jgi:hypothetical protein